MDQGSNRLLTSPWSSTLASQALLFSQDSDSCKAGSVWTWEQGAPRLTLHRGDQGMAVPQSLPACHPDFICCGSGLPGGMGDPRSHWAGGAKWVIGQLYPDHFYKKARRLLYNKFVAICSHFAHTGSVQNAKIVKGQKSATQHKFSFVFLCAKMDITNVFGITLVTRPIPQ